MFLADLVLKALGPDNSATFPKYSLDVWVSPGVYERIRQAAGVGSNAPVHATVTSKDALNPYTFHAALQALPQGKADDATAFVSKDIEGEDWCIDSGAGVDLAPLQPTSLIPADALTIRLDSRAAASWSDDEVEFAENHTRVQHQIAYQSQKIWIKPATKQPILAVVSRVLPRPKDKWSLPYLITDATKITFEGLPLERQKVIDFSKIGGLDPLIRRLREIIQIPLQYPHVLEHFSVTPPKGLLLHGPPGNGKTLIARAVSHSMGARFISIEGPELFSKYVGEAERRLRDRFEEATTVGNSVLFIDEIDSVAAIRDKSTAEHEISIVATLLNQMDGIRNRAGVFVIGATNRPHAVDPALRRPGRFELEFEVPMPNVEARYDILTKYVDLSNRGVVDASVDERFLTVLSELTSGYSGADLSSLYRQGAMNAIRRHLTVDKTSGKMRLGKEPADMRLRPEDLLASIRAITPTSLRGVDQGPPPIDWDEVIGLSEQRRKLLDLQALLAKQVDTGKSHHRLPSLNVLFCGREGTGRKTLIRAFAAHINYELLFIDLLDILAAERSEVFYCIDAGFRRAKQVAPSILYIRNLQYVPDFDLYLRRTLNEANKLTARHKVILVAELTGADPDTSHMQGHKAFGDVFDFNSETLEADLRAVFDKYDLERQGEEFSQFRETFAGKTMGQVIADVEESLLKRS